MTDPGGRGFFWDSGNGNPFRSCFYDPSTALYRFELTTPTRQRATVQIRFTSLPTIVPGFATVGAECDGGGNTTCADGRDGAQRITGAVLMPRPKLGPLPTSPAENYRFCASESLPCSVQNGTTVAFGTGTAFVQKVVDGPSVRCTTEQFGGVDPAPGKFKDCFVVR
ncbi:hypothetical protein [Williamsia deligens]|uniref:Uncharacterized protein n=1 Tax=Williamsia deligens TaxID=321325 RepID=A0ABW3G5D5_9NOCA|nr:hypothetical protein [Williamsia deligens]MCP2193454.1 hypothetical protein [Williamsia deligens]